MTDRPTDDRRAALEALEVDIRKVVKWASAYPTVPKERLLAWADTLAALSGSSAADFAGMPIEQQGFAGVPESQQPSNLPAAAASHEPKRAWWWVHPNPASVDRELMVLQEVCDWMRDWQNEGLALEGQSLELELVFLTDAEVQALPDV